MKPFLEFLMTAEELSRAKVLADIPWANCFVPIDMSASDATGVWYSASCFVIQNTHAIASAWHEFSNYEGIARISLYEERNLKPSEPSKKSSAASVNSSVGYLFENMQDAQDFFNNKKECFIISQKINGNNYFDALGREAMVYSDSGILFKCKENQLLFLSDDMPMWVKITSNKVAIDEVLSACHCLRVL